MHLTWLIGAFFDCSMRFGVGVAQRRWFPATAKRVMLTVKPAVKPLLCWKVTCHVI